jgi:hypothetical protein
MVFGIAAAGAAAGAAGACLTTTAGVAARATAGCATTSPELEVVPGPLLDWLVPICLLLLLPQATAWLSGLALFR